MRLALPILQGSLSMWAAVEWTAWDSRLQKASLVAAIITDKDPAHDPV